MTEAQKYQKKKNALIMIFMLLLVVFVGLICFILIYAKNNPKREYDDPSTIEIKEMLEAEYQNENSVLDFTEVVESTNFIIKEESEDVTLEISENKEIVRNDTQEKISIIVNDLEINNNVKLLYQNENDNILLTEDGKIYRISEPIFKEKNKLSAGRVLSNIEIKNIVNISVKTDSIYVLTTDNKIINIDTQKEYDGIARELNTNNGILYIYDDYSITFEKGKVITDTEGNNIKFNVFFDNKLVDANSIIYEIDFTNKKIKTSNLGKLEKSGYGKTEDTDYNINIETNTGIYNFTSSYYYSR